MAPMTLSFLKKSIEIFLNLILIEIHLNLGNKFVNVINYLKYITFEFTRSYIISEASWVS